MEMGAYEALWDKPGTTFKTLSEKFAARPDAVPSDFVSATKAHEYADFVQMRFREADVTRFGVRIHGAGEYPQKLRDAAHPIELLYYQGWWDLVESRSVAVVGTREPTKDGIARATRLVKELVKDNFTIVSGLASGIDTIAHETAIEEGGRTIAVIGTPLSHVYPKDNAELQRKIAREFLLISQVPVKRYERQDYRRNRLFFPERNITMSALTEATIIVEAGETSGTLIQARAALNQGRKLFILDNCFRKGLSWPRKFADKGAVRVVDYDDIRKNLSPKTH
jgi:DNA processing protein